jgi:hypothetical protein
VSIFIDDKRKGKERKEHSLKVQDVIWPAYGQIIVLPAYIEDKFARGELKTVL